MLNKNNPRGPYRKEDPAKRFWRKVDPCRTDGCAIWVASLDGKGYGQFLFDGRVRKAYTFLVGDAPAGLVWDHVHERGCTNKACVWPEHLEAVTSRENIRRGIKGVLTTHCPQGHDYTPENTYVDAAKKRHCRTCHRSRQARAHDAAYWRAYRRIRKLRDQGATSLSEQ